MSGNMLILADKNSFGGHMEDMTQLRSKLHENMLDYLLDKTNGYIFKNIDIPEAVHGGNYDLTFTISAIRFLPRRLPSHPNYIDNSVKPNETSKLKLHKEFGRDMTEKEEKWVKDIILSEKNNYCYAFEHYVIIPLKWAIIFVEKTVENGEFNYCNAVWYNVTIDEGI